MIAAMVAPCWLEHGDHAGLLRISGRRICRFLRDLVFAFLAAGSLHSTRWPVACGVTSIRGPELLLEVPIGGARLSPDRGKAVRGDAERQRPRDIVAPRPPPLSPLKRIRRSPQRTAAKLSSVRFKSWRLPLPTPMKTRSSERWRPRGKIAFPAGCCHLSTVRWAVLMQKSRSCFRLKFGTCYHGGSN